MNEFQKQWITSTCVPESITSIKTQGKFYLDLITNEDKTIKITVLSNDDNVISIGKTYHELLDSPEYTFKEAVRKVAELLQIDCLTIK